MVAASAGAGLAGAATVAKDPPFSIAKPCSYVTTPQVSKAFGSPVTVDPTNRGANALVGTGCAYLVGPNGQTGVLVANALYGFFPPPGQTALDALESQRANDSLGGLTIVDANVGKKAYVDLDRSLIAVATGKKFAFTLQWFPAGAPDVGGPLDAKTRQKLTNLAKQVTARAPKK